MESQRSSTGNAEDNTGIPDDLRCKRSDGKQWRCTAMSMPDKTVCEKHYIQAKKRAANSALRASLKKAKRKPSVESEVYFDSKSDDLDISLEHVETRETSTSGRKTKEKLPKSVHSSPDSPPLRRLIHRNSSKLNNDHYGDAGLYAGKQMSYRIPTSCMVDSSRNVPQRSFDSSAVGSEEELSDADTESSDDGDGLICHQCRRAAKVVWCLKCDRRGFCARCISTWYSDIPLEELQKSCPACRSTCTCKACLKADNLIKAKIREIHVLDKLQYLHCLLSSVLPFVRQIHQEQCDELALEKKLHGSEGVLERTKLNADEQMCCDCCRVPIVDFHRHCPKCSYDLCLSCCQDLREASMGWNMDDNVENHASIEAQDKDTPRSKLRSSRNILLLGVKYPGWRANGDGSIPCLPRQHGGCGLRSLTLRRIFKLNWVGKLVKNLEEMVTGCKINVDASSPEMRLPTSNIRQCAYREDTRDNFLYCPSSEDIQAEGIHEFRNQWVKGKPAIIRLILDDSSIASWDPMVLWRQIHETTDERMRDANRIVKAVDCLDWSEVDIQLGQLIRGYSEGQINKNGWPQMLKLKDWPSPSATEEFLMYQRPEFISKLPLLEFIHSKWGLLNVAAKLPHYSLQNDAGPKILISYGTSEELGFGDSVTNLHLTMRDTAYLLVHSSEIKRNDWKKQNSGKLQNADEAADSKDSPELPPSALDIASKPELYNYGGHSRRDKCSEELVINKDGKLGDQTTNSAEENTSDSESDKGGELSTSESSPGALWDVFRREDVAKLTDYIYAHWNELGRPISANSGHFQVTRPLYAEAVYLNSHHKRRIKEEFGVEPWSFEQHVGHAVFIPAGCPFQVRNLQSTVQLAFDFLSPESLEEAVNMAEEIRCLPNDHSAKLQMMEVGKISLYAASSAIKEVQKLVLDPKLGAELGFEDPNLTAKVSENLEKMVKQRQITCI